MASKNLNRIAAVSVLSLVALMGLVISQGLGGEDKEVVAGASIIRECPDEWIVNKMPGVIDGTEREEYFVVQGERRETTSYDYAWVIDNCDITPTEVF